MNDDENLNPNNQEQKENLGEKVGNAVNNVANAPKTAEGIAKTATEISQKTRSTKLAQSATKVASNAQRAAGIAAKLLSILGGVLLVVVIIIVIIGLITFVISGLGLIWNGISEITKKIGNYFTSITEGSEYIIEKEDLQDVMNYLVGMDYDLYGYGFVTAPEGDSTYNINDEGNVEIKTDNYDNNSMEENPNEANPFRYLTTYLISDNYSSIIKNSNKSIREAFSDDDDEGVFPAIKNYFEGLFGDTINWRFRPDFCIL